MVSATGKYRQQRVGHEETSVSVDSSNRFAVLQINRMVLRRFGETGAEEIRVLRAPARNGGRKERLFGGFAVATCWKTPHQGLFVDTFTGLGLGMAIVRFFSLCVVVLFICM